MRLESMVASRSLTKEHAGDDDAFGEDSGGSGAFALALQKSKEAFKEAVTKIAPVDPGFDKLINGIVNPIISSIADGHERTIRSRLAAQTVTFDMKLAQARTAGKLALANQAAQLEFEVNEKMEQMVAASKGESSALVEQAHREAEQAKREVAALKMKCDGLNVCTAQEGGEQGWMIVG